MILKSFDLDLDKNMTVLFCQGGLDTYLSTDRLRCSVLPYEQVELSIQQLLYSYELLLLLLLLLSTY